MKIGFFGDSFCQTISAPGFTTYLTKLATYYNAEIVHTGVSGSSIGDVLINQLPGYITDNCPDIFVFVWTDPPRLFNREIRNINPSSISRHTGPEWQAANDYYKYLHDHQFCIIQYSALLEYIDNHVLSKISSTAKIIHLWSFVGYNDADYHYRWKNGVEIRPALIEVSGRDAKFVPNHLAGEEKNMLVFNWIKEAIDNYTSGTLLTKEINYEH
jgi:hypothetical protein